MGGEWWIVVVGRQQPERGGESCLGQAGDESFCLLRDFITRPSPVRLVVRQAQLLHGVEDTAVHGLQAVADVREGAADERAHGVRLRR